MKNKTNRVKMTTGGLILRIVLIALILAFVIYPNINIVLSVLFEDGHFSTEAVTKLLKSKRAVKSMKNSLILGVSLTITVNVIGVLSVLFTEYWDIRGSKLLKVAYMTPLFYGGVVLATGYLYVYGQRGIVTTLLLKVWPNMDPNWFQGYWAVLFMMSFACTSNHIIFLTNAIRGLDYHVIEAAQNMGASDLRILFKVVLPCLLPTIFSLSIMTFLTGICALSGPLMVGGSDFQTINPMIVTFAGNPNSRDLGAMLAIFLGLLTVVFLVVLNYVESKGNYMSVSKTKAKMKKQKIQNPALNLAGHLLAWGMFLVYVLPICLVIFASFNNSLAIQTYTLSWKSLTLDNYAAVFAKKDGLRPYIVSVLYSIAAAVIAAGVCVLVARIALKKERKADRFFEYGVLIPWMLPTTFVALGILYTFNESRWFVGNKVLVGTIWAMLIAYIVVKLPFSFRMIRAAFFGVDDNLEEAAKAMGAKPGYTLVKVILPVIMPTVLSVIALNFNSLLSDYDLSVFLYTPRFQPLGIVIKSLSDATDPNGKGIMLVYSVILMVICSIVVWLTRGNGADVLKKVFKRKEG